MNNNSNIQERDGDRIYLLEKGRRYLEGCGLSNPRCDRVEKERAEVEIKDCQ
jgi:hypothetical protein